MAAFLVATWLERGPGVVWRPYSPQLLTTARQSSTPVILDFSADWCTPCRKLEDETFHDPRVVALADDSFLMIKIDLTRSGNALHENLAWEYRIRGVTTVIFLGRDGREKRGLRLVDYLAPDPFLQRMEAARRDGIQVLRESGVVNTN